MPPDSSSRGLIRSLVVDADQASKERLADIVLMVALSDAFLSGAEFDRIKSAMLAYRELEGLRPEWIDERAEELKENAPLFSETRVQIARELVDPRLRRLGLSFAAKIAGDKRPLQEEEKTLLFSLAEAFRIPDAERDALTPPWSQAAIFVPDTTTYDHADFNAPDRKDDRTLFEAMIGAETELQFRLLAHKLGAIRTLITQLFEGGELDAVGELLRVGPYGMRVDALISHDYEHYIARFLAAGEALYPLEHAILQTLAYELDPMAHVLIVHSGNLSPSDRIFLSAADPGLIRAERLEG